MRTPISPKASVAARNAVVGRACDLRQAAYEGRRRRRHRRRVLHRRGGLDRLRDQDLPVQDHRVRCGRQTRRSCGSRAGPAASSARTACGAWPNVDVTPELSPASPWPTGPPFSPATRWSRPATRPARRACSSGRCTPGSMPPECRCRTSRSRRCRSPVHLPSARDRGGGHHPHRRGRPPVGGRRVHGPRWRRHGRELPSQDSNGFSTVRTIGGCSRPRSATSTTCPGRSSTTPRPSSPRSTSSGSRPPT